MTFHTGLDYPLLKYLPVVTTIIWDGSEMVHVMMRQTMQDATLMVVIAVDWMQVIYVAMHVSAIHMRLALPIQLS